MKTIKTLSITINTSYLLVIAFYIGNWLFLPELPARYNEYIFFICLGHLFATPLVLIWNLVLIRPLANKIMLASTPLLILVFILFAVTVYSMTNS